MSRLGPNQGYQIRKELPNRSEMLMQHKLPIPFTDKNNQGYIYNLNAT
jgi:hypothetical protein